MNIIFSDKKKAFEDFIAWSQTDKKIYKKICALIKDIMRHPYEGIGKPEPLKYELSGYWSRRIDGEHRLVYKIADNDESIIIVSCKDHYN